MEILHAHSSSDASFATNVDHLSQLDYTFVLSDEHNNVCVHHYASYKSCKVARSVLGAENYAFADAYDFANCF